MNILIVKTSALGDLVHSLPALRALRQALPTARLGWVVEEVFAPLLAGHPDLDALFPIKLRPWRKQPLSARVRREFLDFRASVRSFAADAALDLMGNYKGAALTFLSGARRRIGAARQDRREPGSAVLINEPVKIDAVHAVDRNLALLAPFVITPPAVDFGGARLLPQVPAEAQRFFAETPTPYVLIQAGAGWGNKCYPNSSWGEVARQLRDATGLAVRVPTAPGEEHLAAAVVAASHGAAQTVAAHSLPVLVALLRRARLLLGGDTGPVHLAHALGTPVLCLLGPTDPRRFGPYGAPERALFRQLPCSFCHRRLAETKACLLDLRPQEVVTRALTLLHAG